MRRLTAPGKVARLGFGLWAGLLPLLLWQLPPAWHRCQALAEQVQAAVQTALSPRIVVIAPAAIAVQTAVKSDGLKTSVAVAGFDAAGCIRYAGSSEALSTSTLPLTVYLRPLALPDCMGRNSP